MKITHPRIMLKADESLAAFGSCYTSSPRLSAMSTSFALWPVEEDPAPLAVDLAKTVADRLEGAVLLAGNDVVAEGVVAADDLDGGAERGLRPAKPPGALARELGPARTARLIDAIRQRQTHGVEEKKTA
ncbi:hypothetical protein JHW45_01395 [Paracoccus stylophorae]|uniref:Uncharacterized protein n=1 Tax=Paracoccus stylophorae TaxID=659350 RepID=A0ABY7SW15_9RHOB|nr:hypothetical protein [Paracoccus stylophorae]WCR11094.1 hypothetical protein JHW45_01395 [Paracoccus stylophorae]